MKRRVIAITLGLCLVAGGVSSQADDFPGPFLYMGDGTVTLQAKQGGTIRVTYRRGGIYDAVALQRINQVFGAPWEEPTEHISLRLIELLDALQDHFGGATILLRSGYRSPTYNAGLRAAGKLAAQSSLHMEGEAIDCRFQGVESPQVFEYVKGLNCCGVGYYHGTEVHIDAGPPRFWDETTSGTESREPQENAKIMLATDRDRYRTGEAATLRFMRITDYPVTAPAILALEWQPITSSPEGAWKSASVHPDYYQTPRACRSAACPDGCIPLRNRPEAKSVRWQVQAPEGSRGPLRARLRARLCERMSPKMPEEILSNPFEIFAY